MCTGQQLVYRIHSDDRSFQKIIDRWPGPDIDVVLHLGVLWDIP